MSNKIIPHKQFAEMGSKKVERYIQPSILMILKEKTSYGYELIQNIGQFEFVQGNAPPGMIYRHLREMEDLGLVVSEWKTDEGERDERPYQDDGGDARQAETEMACGIGAQETA